MDTDSTSGCSARNCGMRPQNFTSKPALLRGVINLRNGKNRYYVPKRHSL